MADFNMSRDITLSDLIFEIHDCELLPLYCTDCDCPLCGDCVTCDHVGHKVKKSVPGNGNSITTTRGKS